MQNGLPGFDADAASDAGPSERVRNVRAVPAAHPQPAPAGFRSPRKCPRSCPVRLRDAPGVARPKRGNDGGVLRLEDYLLAAAPRPDRGREAPSENQSRTPIALSAA